MEIWKDIDIAGYEVSNHGRVRKTESKKVIRFGNHDGYERLVVRIDGKTYNRSVHRLVAIAFIPNYENKPEVNHINGIRNDNRVENLEWCTRVENLEHAWNVLGFVLNPDNAAHNRKITDDQVRQIKTLLKEVPYRQVAEIVGTSFHIVRNIYRGKTWKHIA